MGIIRTHMSNQISEIEHDFASPKEGRKRNEPKEFMEQRDIIRDRCLSMVESATARTILGHADVRAYRDMVFSESSLELVGITTHEDKLAALRDNMHNMIPKIISDAEKLEREFEESLRTARDAGGISAEDVETWKKRLNDPGVIYMKKKEFIKNKFKEYKDNWIKLGEDLQKIKEQKTKYKLTDELMPELKPLKAAGFLDTHFLCKRDRPNAAMAAIAAFEKGQYKNENADMQSLYDQAQSLLQQAAHDEVLSEWKVGEWMKKIFESASKPDVIKKFINGNDTKSLRGLIRNWTKVRSEFDDVETKRKDLGTPRTFHFVHLDVFLGWHYERRRAYVAEANNRFKDINKEPYIFLKIRNALDVKDWLEADELIVCAQQGAKTLEHREKIESMKKYLREHRGSASKEDDSIGEIYEANENIKQALAGLPSDSIRNRFKRALQYDYQTLWALCTMYYNWEWCRQRGFSSDEKDVEFEKIAKEETYDHLKHGQPDDYAINDFTSDTATEPAARSANDTKSPQVIHLNDTTDNGALLTYVHHNRNNRAVWYWTRFVEKDVPFEKIQEMIQHVQPVMKKSMRTLEKHGYGFGMNGPTKKNTSLYERTLEPSRN